MRPEDLNENHHRRILTACRYVDRLMLDAVRALSAPEQDVLFQGYVADATDEQREYISKKAAECRQQMLHLLQTCHLEAGQPATRGVWGAQVSLLYANNALEEIKPRNLIGSGNVPDDAGAELEREICKLQLILKSMSERLCVPNHDADDR